jgi:predicted P-loop ATPase
MFDCRLMSLSQTVTQFSDCRICQSKLKAAEISSGTRPISYVQPARLRWEESEATTGIHVVMIEHCFRDTRAHAVHFFRESG